MLGVSLLPLFRIIARWKRARGVVEVEMADIKFPAARQKVGTSYTFFPLLATFCFAPLLQLNGPVSPGSCSAVTFSDAIFYCRVVKWESMFQVR